MIEEIKRRIEEMRKGQEDQATRLRDNGDPDYAEEYWHAEDLLSEVLRMISDMEAQHAAGEL